jgi:hypothetical protein
MPEGPVDEPLPTGGPDHGALDRGRKAWEQALGAEHPAELPFVPVDELGVVAKRGVAVLVTGDDRPQLVAELDPEVEGGANPLGGQRDALARRVADEEDPILCPRPELVRDPVALVADRRSLEIVGEQDGGVLYVEARIERADADPAGT